MTSIAEGVSWRRDGRKFVFLRHFENQKDAPKARTKTLPRGDGGARKGHAVSVSLDSVVGA